MLSYVVTILTSDKLMIAEVLFSLFVLTAYFRSSRAKPRVWPRSPPLFIGLAFYSVLTTFSWPLTTEAFGVFRVGCWWLRFGGYILKL